MKPVGLGGVNMGIDWFTISDNECLVIMTQLKVRLLRRFNLILCVQHVVVFQTSNTILLQISSDNQDFVVIGRFVIFFELISIV